MQAGTRQGRTLIAAALCALLVGACGGGPHGPLAASAAGDREQFCRNQMYGARTAQGRSAPNWNLYDQCMRGG